MENENHSVHSLFIYTRLFSFAHCCLRGSVPYTFFLLIAEFDPGNHKIVLSMYTHIVSKHIVLPSPTLCISLLLIITHVLLCTTHYCSFTTLYYSLLLIIAHLLLFTTH